MEASAKFEWLKVTLFQEMASVRLGLKVYSLLLGGAISFLAFLWVTFELYVVSQTAPDQVSTGLKLVLLTN